MHDRHQTVPRGAEIGVDVPREYYSTVCDSFPSTKLYALVVVVIVALVQQ